MSFKCEATNAPSNVPLSYDRPPGVLERRASPSPGPSSAYNYYDRYGPPHAGPPYREDYSIGYASDSWRAEPELSYYARTPSPERYAIPIPLADDWEQPAVWSGARTSWLDVPQSRDRVDTVAGRMFEPSDSWKHTHNDSVNPLNGPERDRSFHRNLEPPARTARTRHSQRPVGDHYSPLHDRYSPSHTHYSPTPTRGPYSRDHYSPPRDHYSPSHDRYTPRDHYSPPRYAGDRYRPYSPAPGATRYPYMNPRSDSYRPQYDDDRDIYSPYPSELHGSRFDDHDADQRYVSYPARTPSPQVYHGRRYATTSRSLSPGSHRLYSNRSPGPLRSDYQDRSSPRSAHSGSSRVYTPYRDSRPRSVRNSPASRRSFSPRRSRSRSYTPPSALTSRAPSVEPALTPAVAQGNTPVVEPARVASVEPVAPGNTADDLLDYDSLASTPHEEKYVHFPAAAATPPAPPVKLDIHSPPVAHSREDVASDVQQNIAPQRADDNTAKLQDIPLAIDVLASVPEAVSLVTQNAAHILENAPSSPKRDGTVNITHGVSGEHSIFAKSPKDMASAAELVDWSDMEMSEPPTPASDPHREVTADLPDYAEEDGDLPDVQPMDGRTESPPQTGTPSSRYSSTEDSDMELSPPPSPTTHLTALESDNSPPARLRPQAVPRPAVLSPPSRAQILRSKLEKLHTGPPPILHIDESSERPELLNGHQKDDRHTPSDDESDMDMSPLASPTAHSPSVESTTAVPFDASDVAAHPLTPPPPFDDPPEHGSRPPSQDLQAVEQPQKLPTLAELAAAEVVFPPPVDDDASVPSLIPELPHHAAPLSLTIIPVAYQDSKRLHTTMENAVSTVADAASVVPIADTDQVVDETPEPMPLSEALRLIVMTRLRCDRQTREERINPVLLANFAMVGVSRTQPALSGSLVQEVFEGEREQSRQDVHDRLKPSLAIRFAQRQAVLTEKVQVLREEYLDLHERWLTHCAKLDDVAKAHALEEAAATAGRTTRRSAALGDAVRSDLEMEQIIASLGNEELTDANHLAARNAATIPDMFSVTRGAVDYLYDDTNNVVDEPLDFYAHRTGIDDWTEEEKEIFVRQFALYPKQFGIIADSLPHKTTAQCVVYYYLHKRTYINFRQVVNSQTNGKRKRGGRRTDKGKGNALLTDIRRHDDEVSRSSTPSTRATRRKRANPTINGEPRKTRKTAAQLEQSPLSTPTPDPEPESRRRRRRPIPTARAVASVEQEVDDPPAELEPKPARKSRRGRKIKSAELVNSPTGEELPVLVNETRFIDQTELTTRKKPAPGSAVWSEHDKVLFLQLLGQHGDDFKRIAAAMPNKTTIQVSTFYKTHLAELDLEKVAASAPKRSPTPNTTPDMWNEASFPGSGVITPSTIASTPADGIQVPMAGLGLETRFRFSEHVPPSLQRPQIPEMFPTVSEREQRPTSVASDSLGPGFQFRPTSVDTILAQYSGTPDYPLHTFSVLPHSSRHVDSLPGLCGSTGSVPVNYESAASSSTSAPLTMTFPSNFAYSNLSPSHFTGDIRPSQRSTAARDASPPGTLSSSTMTFDASMFPHQPWMHKSSLHIQPGAPTPGPPAALQTTEDLRAYLLHQASLGRQVQSDFDLPF